MAAETLAEAHRVAEESRDKLAREKEWLREEEKRHDEVSIWRAESKLRAARDLEHAGKIPAALEFYREIVTRFRNTEQGRVAAERILLLSN